MESNFLEILPMFLLNLNHVDKYLNLMDLLIHIEENMNEHRNYFKKKESSLIKVN